MRPRKSIGELGQAPVVWVIAIVIVITGKVVQTNQYSNDLWGQPTRRVVSLVLESLL